MRERETTFARRWLRTWSARVAASILVLWGTLAAFAPFLANDRPYFMRAVDMGRFEDARTSLEPLTRRWIELRAQGEAGWRAASGARASQGFAETIALEESAVSARIAGLREAIAPEDAAHRDVVARFERAFRASIAAPTPDAGLPELARATAEALDPATKHASSADPSFGGTPVRFASQVSAPLFAALSALDVATCCAWIALGVASLCRRSWRRRGAIAALVFAFAAVGWPLVRPADTAPPSIKASAARGDLVVEWATFPPIPLGHAETRLREAFSPPSWIPREADGARDGFRGAVERNSKSSALPFEAALDSPFRHLLGTDSLGRDLAARLLWGARVSLFVGFFSAVLLTLGGVLLGVLAGARGGWVDFAISRAIEVVTCFPAFVLVLCVMFFFDPRTVSPLVAVAAVIGCVGWTSVARLVRAEALRVRELDFVTAARALGLGEGRILWRHVLPNAIQPAIIAFAFAVGAGIMTESALSFLGFGVQVPVPSWGALISDSKSPDHAWIWLIPGFAIFTVVASTNVLGEALRDALDPRHER